MEKKVKSKENIKYEPPISLDANNVIYWSPEFKELKGCHKGKARATKAHNFVRGNLIRWDKVKKVFLCAPLPGNKTHYTIEKSGNQFECNCQFNRTTHQICSHILGVHLFLRIREYDRREEKDNTFK